MVELDGWILEKGQFCKGDVEIFKLNNYWYLKYKGEIKNTFSHVEDAIYEAERSGLCDLE